jgi:hypothetical protein
MRKEGWEIMTELLQSKPTSWHIGVAAEAFAAAQLARLGYNDSVQYGANQPEYDLIVVHKDHMMKVSVKGSQGASPQNGSKSC